MLGAHANMQDSKVYCCLADLCFSIDRIGKVLLALQCLENMRWN